MKNENQDQTQTDVWEFLICDMMLLCIHDALNSWQFNMYNQTLIF